jgi:hypothetical protein
MPVSDAISRQPLPSNPADVAQLPIFDLAKHASGLRCKIAKG